MRPRGLVAEIRDACDLAVLDVGGDLRSQGVGVDHVGQLSHDQAGASLDLFDLDDGTLCDRTATGAVGVFDALATQDGCTHREVRALDDAEQRFESLFLAGLGVRQKPLRPGGDLTEVVRWDVGGHTDGDTGGTVDQQVREP